MAKSALEEVGLIYQASQRQQSQADPATTEPAVSFRLNMNDEVTNAECTDLGNFLNMWSPNVSGNDTSLTQAVEGDCLLNFGDLQDLPWDFDVSS